MNRTNLVFPARCDNGTNGGGGAPFIDPYGIVMVDIPAGTFTMGSPADETGRESNETQHSVTLSAFKMAMHPVTQAQWLAVMGKNPSYFDGGKNGNRPVEQVRWYAAIRFCNALNEQAGLSLAYTIYKRSKDPNNSSIFDPYNWTVTLNAGATGYRLPTEAQWEYACRAGTTTPFNTGKRITTAQANYDGVTTTRVGTFAPNAWDLYDMHGNVWEWCWDWYGDYSSANQTNPLGAAFGSYRVRRGGWWRYNALYLRSACRGFISPAYSSYSIGFRLVRP